MDHLDHLDMTSLTRSDIGLDIEKLGSNRLIMIKYRGKL